MMGRPLNITFLDFDDIKNPLLSAGQAHSTLHIGSRLVALGHRVEVITSRYPGSVNRLENGIHYRHIGLGSANLRLNNAVYILVVPFVAFWVKSDIIIECFTAPISTLMTPLWTRHPVVAVPTSFEADRFSQIYHLPFHLWEKIGLRFYKYFLPYNPYLDRKMKQINPRIVSRIVGQGVDPDLFTVAPKTPRHILYLGRLDISQKGLDLLIAAYARSVRYLKLPLVIAGHGPDENRVRQLIFKYRLTRRITLAGPAYGDKKRKLLSQALFSVMSSRHEGFGLSAIESLAAGVPVVCFDIPGLSWISPVVSFKAAPFRTDSFSRSLLACAKSARDPHFRHACKTFAAGFSWDEVARSYLSFFYYVLQLEHRL